ncbi:MAG: hypothetical protein GXY28_09610, partial [Bacteriovoracaceae bacterium]|nr:hypothetical protein [Pseudomonadota bacterium]NLW68041.1 hypothetical protein [Bacteriovoracaceae bacterium]
MKTNPNHRSTYEVILSIFAALVIGVLFFYGISPAQADETGRPADGKHGKCMACHANEQVLSETHVDTKDMAMQQCLMCHGPEKIPLSEDFMSIHERLLSGGSSAEGSGVEERGVSAKGGEAEGSSAVSAKAAAPEAASAL